MSEGAQGRLSPSLPHLPSHHLLCLLLNMTCTQNPNDNLSNNADLEAAHSPAHKSPPAAQQEQEAVAENALDQAANVFSPARVAAIVAITTLASFVSPMTANVFLPALPSVARDLDVTLEQVNLAIFIFMIGQGLSPLFLGGTDSMGRRGIYITCLLIYAGANAGLANLPNKDYAGLLVLRFMQACGSASMIAIGVGVVSDVCTPQNRGSLMGIVQGGSTLGPALGPLFGGLVSQTFGWRGIFWFTFILGIIVLVLVALLLPETIAEARANKALPLFIRTAWVDLFTERRHASKAPKPLPSAADDEEQESTPKRRKSAREFLHRILHAFASPLRSLAAIRQLEVFLALVAFALPFACFYGLTVPLSDQFEQRYGLTQRETGLVFLAPGFGVSMAAVLSGRLMDRSFRKVRAQFEREWSAPDSSQSHAPDEKVVVAAAPSSPAEESSSATASHAGPIETQRRGSDQSSQRTVHEEQGVASTSDPAEEPKPAPHQTRGLSKAETTAYFPLERARLEWYPMWTALMVASYIGYGWTLNFNVHLSVPIIFTFIAGVACGGQFSILGTILVDYVGGKGSSITAVNNLFRCLTGAIVSAVVQYIINGVGIGWCQTIFAALSLVATLPALAMYMYGPAWRANRFPGAAVEKERK
ncbi:hypothetical protein V8E36_006210 [Tilletia maclaganii]